MGAASEPEGSAVIGEASNGGDLRGPPPDEPQDAGGVAATPASPPSPSLELVDIVDSRVGVCLHFKRDGQLLRENLTADRCRARIAALHYDPSAVRVWEWKLEQIEPHPS